jgi:hypothetical protein
LIKTANLQNEIIDLSKELILLDNINLPFSSLLMRRAQKVGSVIVNWKYENLDNTRGTALEGADITSFLTSTRNTGDKNICQIMEKAVSVSNTAQAVELENINDLFAHELNNRLLELKRDLEWYLINGTYTEEAESTPRQMKGLVNFITEDNIITSKTDPDFNTLNAMARKMKEAGTASQNLVLLCDYNMTDKVSYLFNDKTYYQGVTNEFGSPAVKFNLTYGSAYIYTVPSMPTNSMILANMDYLRFCNLRNVQYHDLAVTGDSRKGFIVCENTMKFLHPTAAVRFLIDVVAPTLASVAIDDTKKIVTITMSEKVSNATADLAALKEKITIATDGTTFAALGANDKVAIINGKLVITFASALSTATNKIKVGADAVADSAGNKNAEYITDAIDASA